MRSFKKSESGFTLIELMTTLMVAGLLFCLSTPMLYYALKKHKEDQALKAVTSGLASARLRAIHQNSRHTVTFDKDKRGYSVVKSADPAQVLDQGNWSESYSLEGSETVQFDPLGRPDRTGRWELASSEQDRKYIITLDTLGRVQYEKKGL